MQVEQRTRLARAVARADTARLLNPDNSAGPRMPLDRAIASGRAYFVSPRLELLVVDVDLPADPAAAADVLAAFDLLLQEAARAGVPHATVPSGRPGHHHGYLVTGTGPARGRLERWARERGLDVRTQGVRPPGSPHRRASVPAPWLPEPDEVDAVVTALTHPADVEATSRLAARLCPVTLPGRVQTAVRRGYAHAGYATASHARMALAVAVRARGGTFGLLETILRDRTSPLGVTFRDRPSSWQRAELVRLWEKAGAWIATGGRPDPHAHLRRVAGAAAAWSWRGTAGGSDLAVLEELIRVGRRAGVRTVGAALADLAVGAGVSVDTARAATRRLAAAGWLHVVALETATTTRTYDLRVPAGADRSAGDADAPRVGSIGDLGADIARRGGMGKVTMRVARLLVERPGVSTAAVAETLAMTQGAARFHLRKLARATLAVRDGASWILTAGAARLRAAGERLGVAGTRERQLAAVACARRIRAAARARFVAAHAAFRRARPGPPESPPSP